MGNYASTENIAHTGTDTDTGTGGSNNSDDLAPSIAVTVEQRPSYLVFVPHVSYKGNSFFLVKQSLSSVPDSAAAVIGGGGDASAEYITSASGVLPTALGLDFVASVSTENLYEQKQEVKTWVVATVNTMIQSLRPYEETKVVHSEYTLLAPITVSVANAADASTSSSYSVLTTLFDWDIVEEPFELFAPGIGEPIVALGGGSYCYRWVSLGQIARQMSTLAGAVGTNRCALHQLFGNEDFQTEALKSILGRGALISSENDPEHIDGNNDEDEVDYEDVDVQETTNDKTGAIRPPPPDYEEDSEEDHQLNSKEEQGQEDEEDEEEDEEEQEDDEEEDPRRYRRQRRVIAASHLKIPKSSVTLGREFYNSL